MQVHSVPVLADWSVDTLAAVLAEPLPCFYVLANTRALPAAEAAARAEEIGTNLRAAAARVGIDPARLGVVSRRDSTPRGHSAVQAATPWCAGAQRRATAAS